MKPVRKAVIPAAGFGTRLLPVSKTIPKEMLPIIDTPVIQHVIEEAVEAGCEDILVILSRGKESLEDYLRGTIPLPLEVPEIRRIEL